MNEKVIKFVITWKDGKKDKFSASFSEEKLENARDYLLKSFTTTVISVGTPPHTFYSLENAQKVEMYE
jgi:hypothetical protein